MPDGLVLGVDTSTQVNVGVAHYGRTIATATVADRMAHVEQLIPLIRRALAEAELDLGDVRHIVLGLGPGPFTGLRVGIATARVLASVANIAVHGICSLDVLAAEYAAQVPATGFIVTTDARRKELYWARYRADGRRLEGPQVSTPEAVPRLPTIGPGAELYPDRLETVPGPRALNPSVLAGQGLTLANAGIEPLYLRRPDASEPLRRKPVLVHRAPSSRPGPTP
jgi:tRNA threonylcarbamoyl adenosine modification protein YeaZ